MFDMLPLYKSTVTCIEFDIVSLELYYYFTVDIKVWCNIPIIIK